MKDFSLLVRKTTRERQRSTSVVNTPVWPEQVVCFYPGEQTSIIKTIQVGSNSIVQCILGSRLIFHVLFLIPYFSCLILYIYIGKTPLDKALQFSKIGTVMFLLQADCQRSPDLMKTEKIRELCGMYPPLTLFLEHEFNQPWNLLRLCRFNIRNSVKPNKLKDIPHQLLLPRTLLNYLTFSDVDLYLL